MRVFIYYVLKEGKTRGQGGRNIVLSVFENVDNVPKERLEVKFNTACYSGFENEICREMERLGRIEKAPTHYMEHKAEEYGFKVVGI